MLKPIFIGTVGRPGSGKSYFSEKLSNDLHFAHLRSDDFRFRLVSKFKKPDFSPEEHGAVFGFMDFLSHKLLDAGVSVIYDVNLVKKEHRNRIKGIADGLKINHVILWVQTPLELAVERARTREFRPIERDVMELIDKGFEQPDLSEKILIVDGTKSYDEQKEYLLSEIKRIMEA